MKFEKPVNPNYCGTVVEIKTIQPLAGCDNVVAALIFGNQVIVSKNTAIGARGVFFPVETELDSSFISHNSLYRDKELNADKEKTGYFEKSGRIRAVKFRGINRRGSLLSFPHSPILQAKTIWQPEQTSTKSAT